MYKNLRWKLMSSWPSRLRRVWAFSRLEEIKLGLDLQGGVHLILKGRDRRRAAAETATCAEQLAQARKDAGHHGQGVPGRIRRRSSRSKDCAGHRLAVRTLADQQVGTSFDRPSGVGGNYVFTMRANTSA
jgi:preprotein translocase subunit SecD